MSAWSEQKNRRSIYGRYAPTKAEILAEFFEFASLVEEIPSRFKRRADHPDPVARLREDGPARVDRAALGSRPPLVQAAQ
jgi:hypothetical protein